MSFTAEHYIKVAEVIRGLPRENALFGEPAILIGQIVRAFREMFEKDNPKFDPIKFVDACYTEDWG
jgi:hypothetical protein